MRLSQSSDGILSQEMKYKGWLKQAEPDNEYMPVPLSSLMRHLIELEHDFSRSHILTHGDAQFTWMQGQEFASGHRDV